MSNEKIPIKELKPIEEVTQVYSGRPGCACGCRGKYFDKGSKMVKRVYNLFTRNLPNVYSWETSKDKFVALDVGQNRTYTMYYQGA
jgi:hypothetical protein